MEQLPVLRSGRRRTSEDRRLMIPTLCVCQKIFDSTLVSGTQRMGHPQCGGGNKQLRKPGASGRVYSCGSFEAGRGGLLERMGFIAAIEEERSPFFLDALILISGVFESNPED